MPSADIALFRRSRISRSCNVTTEIHSVHFEVSFNIFRSGPRSRSNLGGRTWRYVVSKYIPLIMMQQEGAALMVPCDKQVYQNSRYGSLYKPGGRRLQEGCGGQWGDGVLQLPVRSCGALHDKCSPSTWPCAQAKVHYLECRF